MQGPDSTPLGFRSSSRPMLPDEEGTYRSGGSDRIYLDPKAYGELVAAAEKYMELLDATAPTFLGIEHLNACSRLEFADVMLFLPQPTLTSLNSTKQQSVVAVNVLIEPTQILEPPLDDVGTRTHLHINE
eukprot:gene19782-6930_t